MKTTRASDRTSVVYVLPKRDFFAQGKRGRVSHACGFAEGLAEAGAHVRMVSGSGMDEFVTTGESLELDPVENGRRTATWLTRLFSKLITTVRSDPSDPILLVRYSSSTGVFFAALFHFLSRTRCGFEVNSLLIHNRPAVPLFLRKILFQLECLLIAQSDFSVVVSNGLRRSLLESDRISEKKLIVIPNGAHLREEVSPEQRNQATSIHFVYFGIFQQYYDLDLAIEAVGRLQNAGVQATLSLHGTGGNEAELQALASSSPQVQMPGRFDLHQLILDGEFDRNTVLLLPGAAGSLSEIGSPTKLYEYMSLGLPIIAAKIGQPGEVLRERESAVFYEPGNADDLLAAMQLLAADNKLRESIGKNVREDFRSNHTWCARGKTFLTTLRAEQRP